MARISGKSLADRYNDFLDPVALVITAAGEIPSGDGLYLEKAEVIASVGMEPDMAIIVYRFDKYSGQGTAEAEKYLDVGQKIEVKAGYGEDASRIFKGYLHQIEVEDSMGEYVEYTLVCLDVKGLMKKNSVLQVSGQKKTQQILNEILNMGCYGKFVDKKELDPLPRELDQACVIKGETHYDWLCGLASCLDYEFYCGTGTMVFRKARRAGNHVLELSVDYGLQKIRGTVTMAGQTGSVQIWGYNRQDEKVSGRADWTGATGPFTGKLKQALEGYTLTFLDMGPETGGEAEKRARALMGRIAANSARMEAATVGIPQLLPGICAEIVHGAAPSLSGRMYVEEVRHTLDGGGYTTLASGVRLA